MEDDNHDNDDIDDGSEMTENNRVSVGDSATFVESNASAGQTGGVMDTMSAEQLVEMEVRNECAMKLQATMRRSLARIKIIKLVSSRYEKILDPKKGRYYYYDSIADVSSWKKPGILGDSDLNDIAPTYTKDQAAVMIQRQLWRRYALVNVRFLYKKSIIATYDDSEHKHYYFNPKTQRTSWDLPFFMGGKLNHDYGHLFKKKKPKKSRGSEDGEDDDDGEDYDSDDDDSELSDPDAMAKRRQARKYPRSKSQALIDHLEDDDEACELNLTGIGAKKFTSRIFDLDKLKTLVMARNRLTRISPDVQYFVKLEVLDVSYNLLTTVPSELEELTQLRTLILGHNNIATYSGRFYKQSTLQELDLSFNPLKELPVEVGNLELLKEVHEWEVGIGLLSNLTSLDVSGTQLVTWPPQIEKLTLLQSLKIAHNRLSKVPDLLGEHNLLTYFDASHNALKDLPPELWMRPLHVLRLNNNNLEYFPQFFDRPYRISGLEELDISFNKLPALTDLLKLFPKMKTFKASNNLITQMDEAIGVMTAATNMDLSHNSISELPASFGNCKSLRFLDLSHNRVSEFQPTMSQLKNLTELNFSNNQLVEASGKVLAFLGNLEKLDISNNKLHQLPMSLFTLKRLKHIDISHNQISTLHPNLSQLTNLAAIFASFNRIKEVPASICALAHLKILELHKNRLRSLPHSMSSLTSLTRLSLSQNKIAESPSVILSLLPALVNWNLSWNKIAGKSTDWKAEEQTFDSTRDVIPFSTLKRNLETAWSKLSRASNYVPPQKAIPTSEDENLQLNAKALKKAAKLAAEKAAQEDARLKKGIQELNDWHRRLRIYFSQHDLPPYIYSNCITVPQKSHNKATAATAAAGVGVVSTHAAPESPTHHPGFQLFSHREKPSTPSSKKRSNEHADVASDSPVVAPNAGAQSPSPSKKTGTLSLLGGFSRRETLKGDGATSDAGIIKGIITDKGGAEGGVTSAPGGLSPAPAALVEAPTPLTTQGTAAPASPVALTVAPTSPLIAPESQTPASPVPGRAVTPTGRLSSLFSSNRRTANAASSPVQKPLEMTTGGIRKVSSAFFGGDDGVVGAFHEFGGGSQAADSIELVGLLALERRHASLNLAVLFQQIHINRAEPTTTAVEEVKAGEREGDRREGDRRKVTIQNAKPVVAPNPEKSVKDRLKEFFGPDENGIAIPDANIIESLDLGFELQESIDLFERAAHEINLVAVVESTKMQFLRTSKERVVVSSGGKSVGGRVRGRESPAPVTAHAPPPSAGSGPAAPSNNSRPHSPDQRASPPGHNSSDHRAHSPSLESHHDERTHSPLLAHTGDKFLSDTSHPHPHPPPHPPNDDDDDSTSGPLPFQKSSFINFALCPSILRFPRLGGKAFALTSTDDPDGITPDTEEMQADARLYEAAFDCYFGLGSALQRRADKFAKAIREVERRGGIKISCLNIAHRMGEDIVDIAEDVCADIMEKMKRQAKAASKVSLRDKRKNAVAELASQGSVGGGDDEADESTETKESAEEKRGDKDKSGTPSVGGDTKSVTFAGNPENSKSESKRNSSVASQVKASSLNATGAPQQAPLEEMEHGDPIDRVVAVNCVKYLLMYRRQLLVWAKLSLDAAAEFLAMQGWDPSSPAFKMARRVCLDYKMSHLKSAATRLRFTRGRVLQSLDMYTEAIIEYRSATILGPVFLPAWTELIKTLIAQGNYADAKKVILQVLEKDFKIAAADAPDFDILSLFKVSRLYGMLFMLVNVHLSALTETGLKSTTQNRVFQCDDEGLLTRATPVCAAVVHGRTFKKIAERRKLEIAIETFQQNQQGLEETNLLRLQLQNVIAKQRKSLADVKEMLKVSKQQSAAVVAAAGGGEGDDAAADSVNTVGVKTTTMTSSAMSLPKIR